MSAARIMDAAFLEDFRFTVVRFEIKTRDTLDLPPFAGSSYRGAFGNALKRTSCIGDLQADCFECEHNENCPYAVVFEGVPVHKPAMYDNVRTPPAPYVLRPPSYGYLASGQGCSWEIVLIGRAIAYLEQVVEAVKYAGLSGLGRSGGRFAVESVSAAVPSGVDPESSDGGIILSASDYLSYSGNSYPLPGQDKIGIDLVTPLDLRGDELANKSHPSFRNIAMSLLRRIALLGAFHCDHQLETDYSKWAEEAERVDLLRSAIYCHEMSHYSSRSGELKTEGFLGRAVFGGQIGPYVALFLLGELVNTGHGTTRGNGRMKLIGVEGTAAP